MCSPFHMLLTFHCTQIDILDRQRVNTTHNPQAFTISDDLSDKKKFILNMFVEGAVWIKNSRLSEKIFIQIYHQGKTSPEKNLV